MDKLLGKAVEKMLGDDDDRRQDQHHGGGNVTHGGAYPAGGGYPDDDDDDLRGAASQAAKDADDDQSFFSDILGQLIKKKQEGKVSEDDIDEEDTIRSHMKFFGSNQDSQPATSSSLGNAAAMQALQLFLSSSSPEPQSQSKSAFVGLAMAQAAKLFDAQSAAGNVSSGADKQSAVMKAGEMALKMYLKSHGTQSQSASGGSGSGLGGLMDLAGKLMK